MWRLTPYRAMADPLPLGVMIAEPWTDYGLIDSGNGRSPSVTILLPVVIKA